MITFLLFSFYDFNTNSEQNPERQNVILQFKTISSFLLKLVDIGKVPLSLYLDDLIKSYQSLDHYNFLELQGSPIGDEDPKLYDYDYIKKRNEDLIVNYCLRVK